MNLTDRELQELAAHSIDIKKLKSKISGKTALLIWQHVRHNRKYQRDYDSLIKKVDSEYKDFLHEQFCDDWCISHAVDYKIEKPKTPGFYFEKKGVKFFTKAETMVTYVDWHSDQQYILLAIPPSSDGKLVLQQIEKILSKRGKRHTRIKGSGLIHVADNFVVFYLSECRKLKNADVKRTYNSWKIGGTLQDHQIKSKIKSFLAVVKASPHCFFVAPR